MKSVLSEIEYFKSIDLFNDILEDKDNNLTTKERLFILKLNSFVLEECLILSEKIAECFITNYNSLYPLSDSHLVETINKGFNKILSEKKLSLNESLNYNANYRIGLIDGIYEILQKRRNEAYENAQDILYDLATLNDFPHINTLAILLNKNIINGVYHNESDNIKMYSHYVNKINDIKNTIIINKEKLIAKNLSGFSPILNEDGVCRVHRLMAKKGFIEADLSDFKAIFSNSQANIKSPIKWLILYRGKGHKSALRDFLELMLGEINLDRIENKQKIKSFFTDGKNGMELNKKKSPSNHIRCFEQILESAKEKADH